MIRQKAPIDLMNIEHATGHARHWLKSMSARVRMMIEDPAKEKRHAECECVFCYGPYGNGRIGGAACTSAECALCDTIISSGSTNIDKLCLACAKREKLCKHCGADIDLKNRRRKPPAKGQFSHLVGLVKECDK